MNLGYYDVILSEHLPEGKTYLIGKDIFMSSVTYRRSFGWDMLADRIAEKFRAAQQEFDRAFQIST